MEQEEKTLSEKIRDYIDSRKQDRLDKFDKDTQKGVQAASAENVAAYKMERAALRVSEEDRFKPVNWLSDAAKRACNVHIATHVAKFTYSSAKKCTNVFRPPIDSRGVDYISTSSLGSYSYDVAVDDAKHMDVANLVTLDGSDTTFLSLLSSNDDDFFCRLGLSDNQSKYCLDCFKSTIQISEPKSHLLLKQIYWPMEGGGYNLLLPLFASSLAQEIYERIQHARFSEEQKEARAARRSEKESEFATIEFPNIAVQTFGGNQPQNISALNSKSKRAGRAYMLSSAPPTWQSQEKPPLKVKSIFRGPFSRKVYGHLIGLREFLVANLNKRSVWEIRAERARRIDGIVDQLVAYGAGVRSFPAGWSSHPDCHLPLHQKLWLDPNRRAFDKAFEDEFDKKEWQGLVAADFSRFLNAELEKNADIATGDVEFVQWKVLTAQELRLVQDDVKGAF